MRGKADLADTSLFDIVHDQKHGYSTDNLSFLHPYYKILDTLNIVDSRFLLPFLLRLELNRFLCVTQFTFTKALGRGKIGLTAAPQTKGT